jgi:CxxC-x17-CxxC domain-containing protein
MGGPREYHAAVCNSCGNQAMVPFAPRTDRPVYCSTCFDKVRAGVIEPATAPVP